MYEDKYKYRTALEIRNKLKFLVLSFPSTASVEA